jgi:hypothetical protein
MNMEGENKKTGWKIWLYLTPVYILLAIPLVRWTMKINSPDVPLSKDEYGAFNSSKGSVKDANPDQYKPELNYSAYSLHYRSGKEEGEIKLHTSGEGSGQYNDRGASGNGQAQDRAQAGNQPAGRQNDQQAGQKALESDQTKKEMQMSLGAEKGSLTSAVGKMMSSPRAVGALMNNSWIVKGFMGRATVQSALGSPQGLQNLLGDTQRVNNFLNNSVVQAALSNPAVVNAFASSDMAKAILASPAVQGMMANPSALSNLIATNPQAAQLMANPNVMSALMNNPQTAGLAGALGGGMSQQRQ